jgi:predicted nucleotidyltransferase
MSEKDVIEIGALLKKLFDERRLSISKIVLFGSSAKGKRRTDSDIDIIIVSKDFRNRSVFDRAELTTGVNRELVKRTMKPFDILYYSDIEWKNSRSLIINAAKHGGRVIYG